MCRSMCRRKTQNRYASILCCFIVILAVNTILVWHTFTKGIADVGKHGVYKFQPDNADDCCYVMGQVDENMPSKNYSAYQSFLVMSNHQPGAIYFSASEPEIRWQRSLEFCFVSASLLTLQLAVLPLMVYYHWQWAGSLNSDSLGVSDKVVSKQVFLFVNIFARFVISFAGVVYYYNHALPTCILLECSYEWQVRTLWDFGLPAIEHFLVFYLTEDFTYICMEYALGNIITFITISVHQTLFPFWLTSTLVISATLKYVASRAILWYCYRNTYGQVYSQVERDTTSRLIITSRGRRLEDMHMLAAEDHHHSVASSEEQQQQQHQEDQETLNSIAIAFRIDSKSGVREFRPLVG